jgi:hypothetical protein
MLSGLRVKEAHGPPPSMTELPTYKLTLENGVVVAGYLQMKHAGRPAAKGRKRKGETVRGAARK